MRRVGHRPDLVGQRRAEIAQRLRARARPRRSARCSRRPARRPGCRQARVIRPAKRVERVRRGRGELAVEPQHLAGAVERMHQHAAEHLADRVQPVLERRDDAEVAAAAAQRPRSSSGFSVSLAVHDLAVGGDDLGGEQVVAGEAVGRISQPSPPPSVRPAMPVVEIAPPVVARPCACGRGVEVAPGRAALARARPRSGSTLTARMRGEVDHQAVVADRVPAALWPPPRTAIGSPARREADRGDDIGGAGAAAMRAGERSIIPFQSVRAASYPSSLLRRTLPEI